MDLVQRFHRVTVTGEGYRLGIRYQVQRGLLVELTLAYFDDMKEILLNPVVEVTQQLRIVPAGVIGFSLPERYPRLSQEPFRCWL